MGSVTIEGLGEKPVPDEFFELPPEDQQRVVDSLIEAESQGTQVTNSSRSEAEATEPTGLAGSMLIDFQNQFTAASQRTTPMLSAHAPNLISDDVYEDELGQLSYRDPETGELVETDSAKHVVFRDPQDQRAKVYARTPETDKSMVSSAGRILGTGVLGLPGGVASRTALRTSRVPNVPAQPANEVTSAAERIAPSLPKASVGGPIQQSTAAKLADIPVIGRPLEKAGRAAVDEMGQAAKAAAEGFGSANMAKAGAAARTGLEDYITTLSRKRVDRLYDRVDDFVDPNATAKMPATANAVSKVNLERLGARLPPSKATEAVRAALDTPEGLSYQGMKTLRTSIGEMLDSGILPSDISGAELKRVYKALTIDLRNAAKAVGGEKALAAWDKANRVAKLVSERRANLARIVGSKNDEGIISNVMAYASTSSRGDLKLLRQARKAAGSEAWDEISSAAIERLGVGRDGQFSPLTFATAWNKRLTPEGKRILFRSTDKPRLASILDDLATLSTAAQEAQRYVNTSKTGAFVAATGFGPMLFYAPLTALGSALTGNVLARYLARPVAAQAILKWSKVFNRARKLSEVGPGRSAQNFYLQSSKVLSQALAREANAPELAPSIFSELQKAGPEEQTPREQESDFRKIMMNGGAEALPALAQ